MAQDVINKTLGQVSQYNPLSIERGACILAFNCVFHREGIAENRRGFKYYATPTSTDVDAFLQFDGRILAQTTSNLWLDNGSGTFSSVASTTPPSGSVLRSVEAKNNLYVTTSTGVYRLDSISAPTFVEAGVPRPLDLDLTLVTAVGGFVPASTATFPQLGYRAIVSRTDTNANVYYSAPSMRQIVTNSDAANAKNVTVRVYIPSGVTTSDSVLVYRTSTFNATSASEDQCGDEMQLVYVSPVTSTDVTNGYIQFTDVLIDALLGASLYTNASQQGISQENSRPPLAYDVELYKDCVFFGNTSTLQVLNFSIIAIANLSGNVLRIKDGTNTLNLSFGATEDVTIPRAKVFGSSLTAQNIADTAKSICKMINLYASNNFLRAYYVSGASDLPGQIALEARSLSQVAFWLECTDATMAASFSPQPPAFGLGPKADTKSNNSLMYNGLYYSKPDQPEHVPTLNYFPVGSSSKQILRLAALRDSLIIMKEDGVFRLVGNTPNDFSISPLDLTVEVLAPNSVAILGNNVYALSNQGFVSISDSGVEIVSRDITPDVRRLIANPNIATLCSAVGYENEGDYIVSTVSEPSVSVPDMCWVYNYLTKQWSTTDVAFDAAIVEKESNTFYFANSVIQDNSIFKERKDGTDTDYQDYEYDVTITAVGSTTITFTSSSVIPRKGDIIAQTVSGDDFTANIKEITATNGTSYTATVVGDMPGFEAAAATAYRGILMTVKYQPFFAESPHTLKQGRSIAYFPDPVGTQSTATSITVLFESNFDSDITEVLVEGSASNWGSGGWGQFPWGGGGAQYFPTLIPRNKSYFSLLFHGFKHQNAREKCTICTVGINYEQVSDKVGK